MAVPVVFLGFLGLSFAILWGITHYGDPTSQGEGVTIDFDSPCLDDAAPILIERAKQIGMPVEMVNGSMRTTLPDVPNARSTIPTLLTTPGHLVVKGGSFEVDNETFEEVAIDLDNAGMPQTLIKFDSDTYAALKNLDDALDLQPILDGVALSPVKALEVKKEGVLQIHSGEGKTADRMQRAADRAILLAHGPLPCGVTAGGVQSTQHTNNESTQSL